MAGLRGGQAYVASAKQTARGTPNTTYVDRDPFSGGNMAPTREIDSLQETDANRDQGVSFVRQTGSEGSPESYVRGVTIHHALERALGTLATTGSTPNYTHTLTPANALPYVTYLKGLGGTLFEQFDDCKVSELTISADTGGSLTVANTIMGRAVTRLTAEPGSLPTLAGQGSGLDHAVYSFNEAAVTLGGSSTALVSNFELTIANNLTVQQTDDSVPYDIVEGQREVTLGFSLIFETLTEYNKFHYGSSSGTTQSAALATTSADFTFTKGANNSLQFTLPSIAYEEFPVEPSPAGDPVTVDVRARAQRGTSPVLTAVVKNQQAT